MSWREVPILPLCRVFECLSISDCLAAASCCKNWRYAFMFHRIHKEHLSLKVDSENLEKNVFLANIFSRNVQDLEITLASSIDDYTKFTNSVLTRFCDSKHLSFITYVPTSEYLTFESTHNKEFIQRVLILFLLKLCELPSLQGINIHGCGELTVHAPALLQAINQREYFKVLGLAGLRPTSTIASPINPQLFNGFTALQYLSLDYGNLSRELLLEMGESLPLLRHLVLNITKAPEKGFPNHQLGWLRFNNARINQNIPTPLAVTVNCICLPSECLQDLNMHVLCSGIPLTVLRVMFCKTINMDILRKLDQYGHTLKELVWVDSIVANPLKSGSGTMEGRRRSSRRATRQQTPNPLVMMCWRCPLMQNITIHGYWHSAHDLLGMARLRGDRLKTLQVSALLPPGPALLPRQPFSPARIARQHVASLSLGPHLTEGFVQKMNYCLKFSWHSPIWNELHPALRSDSEEFPNLVQDYIIQTLSRDIPSFERPAV